MGFGKAFQLPKATAEGMESLDCKYSPDFNSQRLAMHPSGGQTLALLLHVNTPDPLSSFLQQRSKPFGFPLRDHPF